MYSNKIANLSLLCALLVVSIHVPYLPGGWFNEFSYKWIRCRLAQCAVPTFFIISGYLLALKSHSSGWWGVMLKRKIRTLVIPFFLLNLLFFPIKYGLHYIGVCYFDASDSVDVMNFTIENFFVGIGLWPGNGPVVFPLWYIRALIICFVISPFIVTICEKGRVARFIMLVGLFLLWNVQYKWGYLISPSNSLLVYDLSFKTFFCFSLGIAISFVKNKSMLSSHCVWLSFLFLVFFIVLTYSDRVGAFASELRYNTGTLCAVASLWFIIPDAPLPTLFKGFTFPLYLFHSVVVYLFDILLKASGLYESIVSCAGLIPYTIVVVILTLFLTKILRENFPRISDVLFGGR